MWAGAGAHGYSTVGLQTFRCGVRRGHGDVRADARLRVLVKAKTHAPEIGPTAAGGLGR